ncbi:MAG: hypothetical protein KGI71_05895, partial [Patescibacteria group bacterium]|nr:hypothetical protein [Patescibacteria group bacterium]
ICAFVFSSDADDVTSVTYNGVSMIQAKKLNHSGTQWEYVYYLLNPASGAHTLQANFSASVASTCLDGLSFTGITQSGQPDATNTGIGTQAGGNVTTTITTVANNALAVVLARNNGGPFAAGTGLTANPSATTGHAIASYYSTSALTPAGSQSLTWSFSSGNTSYGWIDVSFSPSAAVVNSKFLAFM